MFFDIYIYMCIYGTTVSSTIRRPQNNANVNRRRTIVYGHKSHFQARTTISTPLFRSLYTMVGSRALQKQLHNESHSLFTFNISIYIYKYKYKYIYIYIYIQRGREIPIYIYWYILYYIYIYIYIYMNI